MIIRFKDRIFEWWLAINTLVFGLFISLPVESMDSAAFAHLRRFMLEPSWAMFFILTGSIHLIALAINGRRWWTPILRSIVTALNTAVYILFGVGLLLSDPFSTGVYIYVFMIGSAAATCFYRATRDATVAIEALRI